MTDYWDFLKSRATSHNPVEWMYDLYKDAYDDSHGGFRYTLSQIPFFSHLKKFEDTFKQWEDQYQNTGTDPAYSTVYNRTDLNAAINSGGIGGMVSKMARSLSDVYNPDVIEDLNPHSQNMYGVY